ncbi:MAG: hypothetical protein WAN60_04010 [Candidatus Sulfotelmatobacter sp.]
MSSAQSVPLGDDLKAVTASGKVENNVYSNSYAGFRLVLPQPPCDPKLNTSVDAEKVSAILLNCAHVVQGWHGMYTFTIALDYRANYPYLQNVEHYVRSFRHSGKRLKGEKTVQTEEPRHMAGLDFSQAVLSEELPSGTVFQGIACTQLRGYLLCFETEAPSLDEALALLNLDGKLELKAKPPTK